ncbi:MAG TPA: shikimate dehydrogenase [Candidatus Acidoferrales bacterium]|nr:shikimate dehydrogenase [Candidatus Acidoferrales bacterium]
MKGVFGNERVCGVVAAETARGMKSQIRLGLRKTRTLELRLDYLRNAAERKAFLSWLRRERPRAVLVATCRRKEGGGLFEGSRGEQIEILAQAVRSGCRWCDVEVETAKRVARDELALALLPARIMVSYHDFRRTPRNLGGIIRRLERAGGQAIKLAAQCGSVSDSVRICELARGRRDAVAIPMGEFGLAGRVLSMRMGSALAYAAVDQATAPGQLSLGAMADLYRAARITRRTRVYGVIGDPIGHSLSPLLHNTAFRARKFDAVLVPFLVRNLGDFLGAIGGFGVAGISVTIPHKETILRALDGCDPLAARIGAVNTVVVRGGGQLYGYNTDYVGVLRSLERRMRLAGSRVLLYGAGGAARAAAFALAQAGSIVCLCARRPQRARALARAVGGQVVARADLPHEFFDAIVNCTPLGMHPDGGSPLAGAELNCRLVMDMVYRPRETELLQLARRKGIKIISGMEMFLAQGFAQYEIWTGERAPENAMRRAVVSALDREEKFKGRRS